MKTIKFENGGFPVLAEFWEHLQGGTKDAFKHLSSYYGNYAILFGCELGINTPNSANGTGYMIFDGEVMFVQDGLFAHTVGNTIVAYKSNEAIPCPELYNDGNQYDMAINTTIKFKSVATPGVGEIPVSQFKNWTSTSWQNIPQVGSTWVYADNTKYNAPQWKREANRVYLRGAIKPGDSISVPTNNSPLYTFPVGARPLVNKYYPALVITSITNGYISMTAPEMSWIYIKTDGTLWANLNIPGTLIFDIPPFEVW
ncbi:MAG: hypothetical protein K1X81_01815 [Bacteroidia bacterium]|nr:hypothetical protein [Bacteroidia bacterium]